MNLALLVGMAFAGSLHCAGMCGPLALLAGRRFAPYVLGKTSTYIFLGAVAGALGHTVSAALGSRALFLIAGALLFVVALDSLGLIRWAQPSRLFAIVAKEGGALLLGAANGLVPCPLTLAFVAVAAGTASPIAGAGVMLVLGAVSAIPLAACAFAGWRLRRFPAVSGGVMLAVAALMLWRGFTAGSCCPQVYAGPMPDLQYPIGKFVYEGPGLQREWIEQLRAAPALFCRAVEGLSDEQLDTPYRPGGWTLRQVVHHLADSHLNCYVRFRLALTEEEPVIKPYDEKHWAELADARTEPVNVSLVLIGSMHRRWVALCEALDSAAFARTYRHPDYGVRTLDETLALYAWHSRHHAAHITSLRERMGW